MRLAGQPQGASAEAKQVESGEASRVRVTTECRDRRFRPGNARNLAQRCWQAAALCNESVAGCGRWGSNPRQVSLGGSQTLCQLSYVRVLIFSGRHPGNRTQHHGFVGTASPPGELMPVTSARACASRCCTGRKESRGRELNSLRQAYETCAVATRSPRKKRGGGQRRRRRRWKYSRSKEIGWRRKVTTRRECVVNPSRLA